jgi:hypothetical protein
LRAAAQAACTVEQLHAAPPACAACTTESESSWQLAQLLSALTQLHGSPQRAWSLLALHAWSLLALHALQQASLRPQDLIIGSQY